MEIVLPIIDPVEKWIKQRLLFQKKKKDKRDLCAKFCVTSKRYNYTLKQ